MIRRRHFLAAAIFLCAIFGVRKLLYPLPIPSDRGIFYLLPHISDIDPDDPESLSKLANLLESLEPGGAAGDVQIGFLSRISIYNAVTWQDQRWKVDTSKLEGLLQFAVDHQRPTVVYLMGDHFAPQNKYLKELLENNKNNLRFRDGSIPAEKYFDTVLNSGSLSTDEALPIVIARKTIYQQIGKTLSLFQQKHPELFVGVMLNGETHHLFRNFYSGTGEKSQPVFTDYSDQAIYEFSAYLEERGLDLPAVDIRTVPFNSNEAGYFKVEGWAYDESAAIDLSGSLEYPGQEVSILIDGQEVAQVATNLVRQDVYEAKKNYMNPNVGFRYSVDYRELPSGSYGVQAAVVSAWSQYEIGRTTITINNDTVAARKETPAVFRDLPSIGSSGIKGYLDQPGNSDTASYKPLAEHWLAFRSQQVVQQINFLGELLVKQGLNPEKIFSYQLMPWMIGGWNEILFGVGSEFFRQLDYQPGVTLYGGNTLNPGVFGFLPEDKDYGIAEWHPQLDKSPQAPLASLEMHYRQGALFLSPYYFTFPEKWRKLDFSPENNTETHRRMLMSPINTLMGSDHGYHAVVKFSAR